MEGNAIHCIGDSHCCFFSGLNQITNQSTITMFKVHHIGPVLAYSLHRLNTNSMGREKLFEVLDKLGKSSVMLCFGEIDCRVHLLKQAELQNKPIEDVVNNCVNKYIEVIKELKEMGFNVLVWGPIPSASDDRPINPKFPAFGTEIERNKATKIFNDLLGVNLPKIGVKLISIFEHLVDGDLKTKHEYQFDGVHLSQKAMPIAINELKKQNTVI